MSLVPQPRLDLRLVAVFYAALFLVGLAWRRLGQGAPLWHATPASVATGLQLGRDLLVGAVAAAAVISASAWYMRRFPSGVALARMLGEAIGKLHPVECAWVALLSGIGEEALFRGAMQPVLGLFATSLVFGLLHAPLRRELVPWTVFAILAGVVLGALYEATDALLAPVTAHVIVNAVNLRRLTRDLDDPSPPPAVRQLG